MILNLKRFFISSFAILLLGLSSLSKQAIGAESPAQKEYLVVMLHGINSSQESVTPLLPLISQAYGGLHSPEEAIQMADKIDFLIPTAINNEWFKVPDPSSYPKLIFDVMVRGHNMTDKLEGFRENLTVLKAQIKDRLQQLNLGSDRLIIAGLSQGGVAASTLGFEYDERVRAVVSAISLWMPSDMKKIPYNMITTNGDQDEIIPTKVLSKVEELFDKRLKAASTKTKERLNFKRLKFPEDRHNISSDQLVSIVSFLDENVFEAPVLPNGKKFSPGGEDQNGTEENPILTSSSGLSEEQEVFTEEEMHLMIEHFTNAFSRFAKAP